MSRGVLYTQKLSFMVRYSLRAYGLKLLVILSQSSLKLYSGREQGHYQEGESEQGQKEVTVHCPASQQVHSVGPKEPE